MANFDDSKFLGFSPKALGLIVVAGLAVVGLFFMPETLKFLFDARVDAKSTAAKNSDATPDDVRASLAQRSLASLGGVKRTSPDEKKERPKRVQVVESKQKDSNGILSGLDFSIPASRAGGTRTIEAPEGLKFDGLVSREGLKFLQDSRKAIVVFQRQNRISAALSGEAMSKLTQVMRQIGSGNVGEMSEESQRIALKRAHVDTLKALYQDYHDRGLLLRWLGIGAISFIDSQGGVNARQKIVDAFWPSFYLSDVDIRQPRYNGSAVSARYPAQLRGKISITGSDISKLEIYANGQLVNTLKGANKGSASTRTVPFNGDAYGFWTIVAYDKYGQRPVSKTYSFYPRVSVFAKDSRGRYQIGFLPGSADNSLDRFFLVGSTVSHRAGASGDAMVSVF
jgi:hypothetical protein